jgi:dienelactone hydrolase
MSAKWTWSLFALVAAAILTNPVEAAVTTIEVELTGHAVQVELHAPDSPSRAAVVLAHGFMRSRQNMTGHATALAREGVLAVVPELPYRTSSRDNGRALVELIALLRAGKIAGPVDRIVLVGFSSGGLSTLLAAASPGVVGYVGLDPFDRPGGEGLAAAKVLRTPAVLIRGPSSFCNAYRISEPWSAALPMLVEERSIAKASHCDFESPTDRWCTLFCGATDPLRQQTVRDAVLAAVRRLLAPAVPNQVSAGQAHGLSASAHEGDQQ